MKNFNPFNFSLLDIKEILGKDIDIENAQYLHPQEALTISNYLDFRFFKGDQNTSIHLEVTPLNIIHNSGELIISTKDDHKRLKDFVIKLMKSI